MGLGDGIEMRYAPPARSFVITWKYPQLFHLIVVPLSTECSLQGGRLAALRSDTYRERSGPVYQEDTVTSQHVVY